ncbi:MAG: transcriptional repressor LexA [Gammaproteobacteria bacterium]|nr:transcriptional repressor LexA [Gammaproteobacteria bacterium]
MELTRRQQAILDFLREHARQQAYPPTLDEVCAALGLRSRGSLHKHVSALVEAGYLEPLHGKQRGLRLSAAAMGEENALPLLGTIAAGRPIEAVAQPESIEVPRLLRSRAPCYVLRVRGDSMVDDGILNGDYVIIEAREQARDGEIVVALVDGHEATLKRLQRRSGEVLLHPANAAMEPMRYAPERVAIQGVLVGQMRRY